MIETRLNNGALVATLKESDRLTATIAESVKNELTHIVSENNEKVLVNLANIKFIDSTGIGVLISALKTARQNNISFGLCCIQKDVMSLLTLMKLDKVFDIYNKE